MDSAKNIGIGATWSFVSLLVDMGAVPAADTSNDMPHVAVVPVVWEIQLFPEDFLHILLMDVVSPVGCMKFNFWLLVPLQRLLSEFFFYAVSLC